MNLRAIRKSRGLRQEELAVRAGVGIATVERIERGNGYDPRFSTVVQLARALDASLDEIAGHGDDSTRPETTRGTSKAHAVERLAAVGVGPVTEE